MFRVTPDGAYHVLYTFRGYANGTAPAASLVIGTDGQLYGMTEFGGDSNEDGTIFKISPDGAYTLLYKFNGSVDGSQPEAALVQASDGNFYGVTPAGGAHGKGTVFRITPQGQFTLLHTFSGSDGDTPQSRLVEGAPGMLYGNTGRGGDLDHCRHSGCGTIFTVNLNGNLRTTFQFEEDKHGSGPNSDLFQGSDGDLYGTTQAGCENINPACNGSIFSVTLAGNLSTLYTSDLSTWTAPEPGGLVQSDSGEFWGATYTGSLGSNGTVYKFTPSSPLPGPVQLSFHKKIVRPNTRATLNWKVVNAASLTMQQCFASIQGAPAGAGTWTGKQTGASNGSTFSGSATITPTVEGTYTYALTCGGIESGFATLTVGTPPPLVIGTASLPAGMLGTPYSAKLAATGGDGDFTWSVSSGALPPGLTLAPGGTLAGTPTGAGTFNFAVRVQDGEDTPVSTTGELAITVQPAASKVTVQVSPSTIATGQNVTLTATVAGVQGAQPPGGTVQFTANGNTIGPAVTVAGGAAALSGALFTTPGTYSIVAHYSGDGNYGGGASAGVQLTVTAPVPGISVTVNPATIDAGGSTTLTAQLAGTPAPTGTVQFLANGTKVGPPAGIASGVAMLASQVFATPGSYAITAVYGGDAAHAGATSSAVTLTVSAVTASLTAVPPTVTVAAPGASGSTTLQLARFTSDAVSFTCAGLPAGAACRFGPLQGTGLNGTVSMQITTIKGGDSARLEPFRQGEDWDIRYAGVLPGMLGFAGLLGRRRRRVRHLFSCLLIAAAGLSLGCGVHVYGTPSGSSSVTVTASAGGQTAKTTVNLTVGRSPKH